MEITEKDYRVLSNIIFKDNYPGLNRGIQEAPNGDGYWDEGKIYSHISCKYIQDKNINTENKKILATYLNTITDYAIEKAIKMGIPFHYWPSYQYSCIRLLEYPPNVGSHEHTDFDLFTINLWRNIPGALKSSNGGININIHNGELLELILPKAYKATKHSVESANRTQYSIVYFAIPDYSAILPNGQTVGDWIDERKSRSRKVVNESSESTNN